MKTQLQRSLFLGTLMGLWVLACHNNDPDPTIPPFTVAAKLVLGVADLKPNNFVNDVNLTWTKANSPNGDSVIYTVFYKDTLAKNLTDTTFTIPNVGNNTRVTGFVMAKTNKGLLSTSTFRITSGIPPHVRLKKWTRSSSDFRYYNYTVYNYDSLGRLTSFNTQEGKVCCFTRGQLSVLKYDNLGRLVSVEALPNGDNTGQFELYLYTYEYDAKGNVGSRSTYSTTYQKLPREFRGTLQYEYNDSNLLIKQNYQGKTVSAYYYKNGNVVQQDIFNLDGSKYSTLTYQYDSSPNPVYGFLCYDQFSDAPVIYSRNYATGYQVSYKYDSNGLLIQRTVQSNPGRSSDRVDQFEYEFY